VSGFLGENSRDTFGLLKRGREDQMEDGNWQRNIKQEYS